MADETRTSGGTPLGQAYRAYEQLEGKLSTALDQLVTTNGFADLLATTATNAMAITRLANDRVDQAVRATRLASRRDVVDLARQLARTEDKLERLLQAVEQLQSRLDQGEVSSATSPEPGSGSGSRSVVNGASRRSRGQATSGNVAAPSGNAEAKP